LRRREARGVPVLRFWYPVAQSEPRPCVMTFETEVTSEFQLRLPVFEGPLDLLLYLIEREELEITAVSLVQVTDQYLSYLHSGDQIDAAALAEFIAIGARLLYLKSRALLPRSPAEEQAEEDLGEDLVQRLREYRRFKEVAGSLREMEELGLRAYPRLFPPTDVPLPTGLDGVTLDLLAGIVREVLDRQPEEEIEGVVHRQEVSVEDKARELSEALRRRKRVSFRAFISACRSRLEIIVAFLAVLELIKGLRLRAEQDVLFGDISLVAVQGDGGS
jgi:segregation and condensation protein A